jgi:hypothetical protein
MTPEEIKADAKLELERMASGEMTASEALDRANIWKVVFGYDDSNIGCALKEYAHSTRGLVIAR